MLAYEIKNFLVRVLPYKGSIFYPKYAMKVRHESCLVLCPDKVMLYLTNRIRF